MNKENIIFTCEKELVSLHGGSYAEGFDSLRYKWFCDKVSKSTPPVDTQSFPPTSAAAKYHSLRVYYQVMVRKDFNHDLKLRTGDGMLTMEDLCPYKLISQQHHQKY